MDKVISLATGKPIAAGKALIVAAEGERFSLRMSPALTDREREVVTFHDQHADAMGAGRYLTGLFPTLYRTVIDRASTGEAR